MKTFTDNTARAWTVSLNVGTLKRVRDLCKVDLMQAVEGKLVEKLIADPVLLCDVLFAVCKEEADKRQVPDEEFGRCLGGDTLDAATTALLEELVDFFPQRRREVLKKALDKMNKLQEKSVKAAMVFLDSPELDRRVENAVANILSRNLPMDSGLSHGSLPDDSASIPIPSPSAN